MVPIMLPLTNYAQNYASIIGKALIKWKGEFVYGDILWLMHLQGLI